MKGQSLNKSRLRLPSLNPDVSLSTICAPPDEPDKGIRNDNALNEFMAFTRDADSSPIIKELCQNMPEFKKHMAKLSQEYLLNEFIRERMTKLRNLIGEVSVQIRSAQANFSGPDLQMIGGRMVEMLTLSEGTLFPYLQVCYLSMTYFYLSGQIERCIKIMQSLICFTAKTRLLFNLLLCYQFYFRVARSMYATEQMLVLVKRRLRLSWVLGCPNSQIEAYSDLSLVFHYMGQSEKAGFFNAVYDAGKTLPPCEFKDLSQESIKHELMLLKEGIFILQDDMDLQQLRNQFVQKRGRELKEQGSYKICSLDFLKHVKKECKVSDQLKFMVKGPVRLRVGTQQFKIKELKQLKDSKLLVKKHLFLSKDKPSNKQLLTHLSRNKNFMQYYIEREGNFYNIYRPKTSWRVLRFMVNILEAEVNDYLAS